MVPTFIHKVIKYFCLKSKVKINLFLSKLTTFITFSFFLKKEKYTRHHIEHDKHELISGTKSKQFT